MGKCLPQIPQILFRRLGFASLRWQVGEGFPADFRRLESGVVELLLLLWGST